MLATIQEFAGRKLSDAEASELRLAHLARFEEKL